MKAVVLSNQSWFREFGSDGKSDGQFTGPTAITHDSDDRIYVADEELNRITNEKESLWERDLLAIHTDWNRS